MSDEDDDLPPPLEDMTAQLSLRTKLQTPKTKPKGAAVEAAPSAPPPAAAAAAAQGKTKAAATGSATKAPAKASSSGFGGFQKGFLFGGSSGKGKAAKPKAAVEPKAESPAKAAASKPSSGEEIPFIRANPKASSNRIGEVQEALKASTPFLEARKDQWLTPEFLQKIQRHPTLARQLADPTFTQAINELQSNPSAAAAKYQDKPEIMAAFRDFCELMAEQMNSLADKEEAAQAGRGAAATPTPHIQEAISPEQEKVNEILKNPEVVATLQDPDVKRLLQELKEHPERAHMVTARAASSPTMRAKIEILYKNGLLGIATDMPTSS